MLMLFHVLLFYCSFYKSFYNKWTWYINCWQTFTTVICNCTVQILILLFNLSPLPCPEYKDYNCPNNCFHSHVLNKEPITSNCIHNVLSKKASHRFSNCPPSHVLLTKIITQYQTTPPPISNPISKSSMQLHEGPVPEGRRPHQSFLSCLRRCQTVTIPNI